MFWELSELVDDERRSGPVTGVGGGPRSAVVKGRMCHCVAELLL